MSKEMTSAERSRLANAKWRAKNKDKIEQYRAANRDKINQTIGDWQKNNRDKCREYAKRCYASDPDASEKARVREESRRRMKGVVPVTAPTFIEKKLTAILNAARARALDRGIEFSLTRDQVALMIPSVCPLLGIPLIVSKELSHLGKDHAVSVDRIDSNLGYTMDNIQIISYRANRIKNDATFEEFERMYIAWRSRL